MDDIKPMAPPDPVARARELGPALAAATDEIERTRRIPEPLMAAIHDSRLLRMLLPRAFGGDQVDPSRYLLAVEEVARHDASIGWNLFVANSAALMAPYMETETAETIFRDPYALVAWGAPIPGRADVVSGGYKINGEWSFASGCRQATWMGAHCNIYEPDGSVRCNDAGTPLFVTFLFPADQAQIRDTWDTIGLRGTASDSYTITDLFVPEAFTGTRSDPTLRRIPGPLYAFPQQSLYAVGVAGGALGIGREMLNQFIELAAEKAPLGRERLADSATVQSRVAECNARLGAAKAYVLETLDEIYANADDVAPIEVPDRARVRLACVHAIHAAIEVADYTYKAAGVDSIFPGSPFERRFRDIHTLSQQIQSRDAHYETIGQVLLDNPPATFF